MAKEKVVQHPAPTPPPTKQQAATVAVAPQPATALDSPKPNPLLGVFWIIVIVGIVWLFRRKKKIDQQSAKDITIDRAKTWLEMTAKAGKFDPVSVGSVLLKRSEFGVLSCSSSIAELKAVPRHSGGAISYRMGHVTLYSGRFNTEGRVRMTSEGAGRLLLTNRRLIFTGVNRVLELHIAKMTSIENDLEHLLIAGVGTRGKPVLIKVDNGPLWGVLIRWIAQNEPTENKLAVDAFG